MITQNRGAGRPKGSGMKNDEPHLRKVADLMVQEPGMLHTTAMKRVIASMDVKTDSMRSTVLRRWQGRWKDHGERHLAEARARKALAAKPKQVQRTYSSGIFADLAAINLAVDRARSLVDTPEFRAARAMMDTPTFREMTEMMNSPTMREIQAASQTFTSMLEEYRKSSATELLRDFYENSPARLLGLR